MCTVAKKLQFLQWQGTDKMQVSSREGTGHLQGSSAAGIAHQSSDAAEAEGQERVPGKELKSLDLLLCASSALIVII